MKILSYFMAAALGGAIVAIAALFAPQMAQSLLGPGKTQQIESVVQSYIASHPEIVAKALEAFQERQKAADLAAQQAAIKEKTASLFNDPADPVLGDAKGDVTIVEFFDYRCPYCKRSMPDVMAALKDDGHVRLVLKEFPILGPNSLLATRAALASIKQGKYAAFHAALLSSKSELDSDTVFALAQANGIDPKRLAEDMKDPAIDAAIKKNYQLAESLKIEGTPAFIIGGQLVPGAIDKAGIERLVKEARRKS